MERYFLIFYTGSLDTGGQQLGYMTSVIKNGNFVNAKDIVKWLKEQNPTTTNFVITNLIELSKSDFETWSA